MDKLEEKGPANGREDYTEDGTVDLKGRPILRSKTGRWRACWFIVGYEVFERMTYSGIASNLVLYLTRKLHEGTVASSNNVTNFRCIRCRCSSWPILDFYHCFCNLSHGNDSVNLSSFRPPSCGPNIKEENCDLKASALQKGIFYGALYIIAAGTGGTKPNISTMGADQFDDFEPKERTQKLSFFNWWMFSIFIGTLFSFTFLVYIQDNVGWALCYALPTIGLAVSIAIFFAGTPFYRHKLLAGSPFTRIVQVFIAAFRKQHVPLPKDHKELHELSPEEYSTSGKSRIDHTPSLRFDHQNYLNSNLPCIFG